MTKKSATEEITAVAVQEGNTREVAVASNASFLSGDIPMEKVKVPRLSLLQANSDSVQILGQPVGTFDNGLTHQNYGDKITLIPIKVNFGALYLIQGEGLKCKSLDGITNMHGDKCAQCPFGVYHQNWVKGRPPECDSTVDLICLTQELEPVILTFRSTGYKEGTKLASALKFNKQLKAFEMTTTREKNDKGTFFVPKILGFKEIDLMQYEAAVAFRQQLMTGNVDIQDDTKTE